MARDGSTIVGYATAVKNNETNQLEAIYVLLEYHGKEVGKQLIELCLEWLGDTKDILVEVASYNHRAIRFYEKHGFKENGTTGRSGDIPTLHMVRQKH